MVHVRWSVTVVGEMNSLNDKSVEVLQSDVQLISVQM